MEALDDLYKYFESLGRFEEVLLEISEMLEPESRSLRRWKPGVELKERNIVTRKAWDLRGKRGVVSYLRTF